MKYSKLAETYKKLEATSGRLEKTEIIASLLKEASTDELEMLALLLQGRVFPSWSEKEIGVAGKMIAKTIALSTGFPEAQITERFNKLGDLGQVAEELVTKKKQQTLLRKELTIEIVFQNLQKLASMEGSGSQERKMGLISELIAFASPQEAKYVVRTVMEELRVGVAEGVLRDAIAKAFDATPTDVENAWFILPDYGEVAKIAKKGKLKSVEIELGTPINVLLAEKSPSLEEALETFESPALEYKYDGARVLIHKKKEKIWIFTRRLEDVTKAFPDIVELVRKNVKVDCILDGEAVGLDPKTGKPVPFQALSTRIKRKYEIEKAVKDIPVQVNLFDLVYLDGKSLFDLPLKKRYQLLKKTVKLTDNFRLAEHLETKDLKEAENFYKKSLEHGEEGLIVKNMDAKYQPGRRVSGGWLKVKPTLENLDLCITGFVWGSGKRTGWAGSLILSCLDENNDKYLTCGMMGTGIKEKKEQEGDLTFDELTKMLKPLIISEKGNEVKVEPKIVIEVACEEIQKSPTYSSGYALRFPRFIRLREDKGPQQADDIKRLETLFNQQSKRK